MKKLLGVVFTLIIVIALLGSCGGGSTDTSGTTGDTTSQGSSSTESKDVQPAPVKTEDFTVLEHSATTDDYGYTTIVGKIKNNTDKEWAYVQIEISLFDKDGNQMGSTLDNINNLGAGATWSFKAMGLEENVARYEIKEVTGW